MSILKFKNTTLHRLRLEELLFKHKNQFTGKLLDIGSKNRRYDEWFSNVDEICAVDLVPDQKNEVKFGDIEVGLDYEDGSFDGILMIEVMEYLSNPQKALMEIARLLRSGGKAILTMPFMYREHNDLLRLTEKGFIECIPENCTVCIVEKIGNRFIVLADIIGINLRNIRSRSLRLIAVGLWLPILCLVHMPYFWKKRDAFYSGMFYIIEKK